MTTNITKPITRDNIDLYMTSGSLYAAIRNGRWYGMRRNGETKRWKKDTQRIAVPFKYGFKGYGKITESDFTHDCYANSHRMLNPDHYRHIEDVPRNLRP